MKKPTIHKLASLSLVIYTIAATSCEAAEVVTHQYDALGRLIKSTNDGGPKTGQIVQNCFDRAGNRMQQSTAMAGVTCPALPDLPPPPPPPTAPTEDPPPPPPPPTQPPVANADSVSVMCWQTASVNVVANDTDPDGNVPLGVVSVSGGSVTANILTLNSISVRAGRDRGTTNLSYTLADSSGATATGTLAVTVTGTEPACENEPGGPGNEQ